MRKEILRAAESNDLTALSALLTAAPKLLHTRNHRQDSLLHIAAERGNIPMLAFLLDQGLDINVSRTIDSTDLHYTPLHAACRAAQLEAMQWLIAYGADLEAGTGHSATPLICAVLGGNTAAVTFMLQAGASARASYFLGEGAGLQRMDAILIAQLKRHFHLVPLLEGLQA